MTEGPFCQIRAHYLFHLAFQLNISFYFILYSENQCISKFDKIVIFIDMKFH